MNETVLRVVQALEIQGSFKYVLSNENIAELERLGYKVQAKPMFGASWLSDCTITKGTKNESK